MEAMNTTHSVPESPLDEEDPFLKRMKEMQLFQKYPMEARLAYTVYLDLKVVKKWNYITIHEDSSQHLCYLAATYSETKNEEQLIVPVHINQNLSFQILHQMLMKLSKDYTPSTVIPNAEEITLDVEEEQQQVEDMDDENSGQSNKKSKKRQISPEEKSKRAEISNKIDQLSPGFLKVDTSASTHKVLNIAFIAPDSTITYYRMFSYLIPPKE